MQLLMLLSTFLLPPGAGAGEIIGGHEARPHSHPYMAYLQILTPNGVSTCGGFLIREDFVLTAAHCLGSSTNVILGAHDIQRQERTQQRISVLRAIPHPEYNPQNSFNDIMLLQLRNRARLNRVIRPVALPQNQTRLRPGTLCTAAGWGLISLSRRTSILQEVQLRIQRDQECNIRFNVFNGRMQICVGNPREMKSVFLGDSGGPLVCNNMAHGIVSYGNPRGTPPAVFTNISNYLSWIKRTMRRLNQLFHKMYGFLLAVFLLSPRAEAGEIIGGKECTPHSRPYMAYLEIVTSEGHLGSCGGFLIRRNFVLTAAHCEGSSIMVILGAHNIKKKQETWQKYKVIKQFPHPEYSHITLRNDIMLLKLKDKANLTLAVGTLPLPSQSNFVPPGRTCRVTGWGRTGVEEPISDTLQEVKLQLMDPQACKHYPNFHHKSQLCVGNSRKINSAFKGDSGGPLLCAGVAQGIVSVGQRDAKPPAVFTRISHYRPWINKVLKENQPQEPGSA
ncbi:uncharacterized protein ACDL77_012261 [Rhynchocyon petersi]